MKKKTGKWLKIILIVYVAAGILLYFLQDRLLFHPEPLPADYTYTFNSNFEERTIVYDSNTVFDIIRFMPPENEVTKGAVIYFHGNMNNIGYYAHFADNFIKHGYEVWMMDYPGYGKSTGTITEDLLHIEATEVYKMVTAAGLPPGNIIIYGKSLGTGIATELAGRKNCKRLVLESPYYSIPEIAAHYAWMYPVEWICTYTIPTYQYIQKVKAPVTIFHGTADATIPYASTEKLSAFLKAGDEVITIEGGGHNDLNNYPLIKMKLDSVLQQ